MPVDEYGKPIDASDMLERVTRERDKIREQFAAAKSEMAFILKDEARLIRERDAEIARANTAEAMFQPEGIGFKGKEIVVLECRVCRSQRLVNREDYMSGKHDWKGYSR